MLSYTAMGTYVLVLTIAFVFVLIPLIRQRRTGKDVAVWLLSGLVGILLGAAGAAAVVQLSGYNLERAPVMGTGEETADADEGGMGMEMGGGMGGGGMGMGGVMGMGGGGGMGMGGGGGGMSMMAGGMGGMGGPRAKRQLTSLVRKIELLTTDLSLHLSGEQTLALTTILAEIADADTMTDEQAEELHDKLLAVFDEAQLAKQDAVGLPRRRGGGFDGAALPGEDTNPFEQEQNGESLNALLTRLGAPARPLAADGEPPAAPAAEATGAEAEVKAEAEADAEPAADGDAGAAGDTESEAETPEEKLKAS